MKVSPLGYRYWVIRVFAGTAGAGGGGVRMLKVSA
jgi:hypothetical protein